MEKQDTRLTAADQITRAGQPLTAADYIQGRAALEGLLAHLRALSPESFDAGGAVAAGSALGLSLSGQPDLIAEVKCFFSALWAENPPGATGDASAALFLLVAAGTEFCSHLLGASALLLTKGEDPSAPTN